MRSIPSKLHAAAMKFLLWGWPVIAADAALELWAGSPQGAWRSGLNSLSFLWIICVPVAPITLLVDRERREKAMARLCGLREGDERERAVTGEAARATLLLSLALQTVLLVMCLVNVQVVWNPEAKTEKKGMLTVGTSFSSSGHMNPFGPPAAEKDPAPKGVSAGGYLLSPSCFPVLAVLILIQLAAFRLYAGRRYDGVEA